MEHKFDHSRNKKIKISPTAGNSQKPVQNSIFPRFLMPFRNQLLFLVILGAAFYGNTIGNEYAIDDTIVIQKNEFVQHGLNGIVDIFTKDSFAGYLHKYSEKNQLSGGRYRPLSLATFAIEQQLSGDSPHMSHFFNVVLFLCTVIALLYLFHNFIFKEFQDIAFLAVLLFTIHPIHTEVVANIKSRDELLSLLFIILTFIFAFQWKMKGKNIRLAGSILCFFLALLSKEWGILLIILLPVSFYVFFNDGIKKSILTSIPFWMTALVFLLIRFSIVQSQTSGEGLTIINNPYLFATPVQAFATKLYILLKYLYLIIIPYPLLCDYSYKTIPYVGFENLQVWVAIVVYSGMTIFGIILLIRRHLLGFAIIFYLSFLAMVSNLFFDLGATMSERLIYHSSVGFCIAVAWLLHYLLRKIKNRKTQSSLALIIFFPVIIITGFITIQRNSEWKNNKTLYLHDVKYLPRNMMVNEIAGKFYIDFFEENKNKSDSLSRYNLLDTATIYLTRSVNDYAGYYNPYVNLGIADLYRKKLENTQYYWHLADSLFPRKLHIDFWKILDTTLARGYNDRGFAFYNQKRYAESMNDYNNSIRIDPLFGGTYNNRGVLKAVMNEYREALTDFDKSIELNPESVDVYRNRGMTRLLLKDLKGAHEDWSKAVSLGDGISVKLLEQYFGPTGK
ncbi:MAG: hypothetical protein NTX61_11215 [Bacteroidetes bacterium]|nr:hypothetical protein [Bacteroidota bacterium]